MRALLSVTDKAGLVPFAAALVDLGWELLATDGTAEVLRDHELPVLPSAEWNDIPVMLGGRVKTLHYKTFLALLCRGDQPAQRAELRRHGVAPIDLVAGNFYRFGEPTGQHADVLDTIDVGGPAMMRAAAKNHPWVLPIIDPSDYPEIAESLRNGLGSASAVGPVVRRNLASKAFRRLAELDAATADALAARP